MVGLGRLDPPYAYAGPAREHAARQPAAVGRFQEQFARRRRLAAMAKDALGQIRRQLAGPMPGEWHVTSTNVAALGRQFAAHLQQRQQMLADLPRLALRAVAVTGRVEDHRVVSIAAFQLAAAELHRVFGIQRIGRSAKPDSAAFCRARSTDVVGRIDVHDLGPGRRRRQRAAARVRKQIQNSAVAVRSTRLRLRDLPRNPIPILALLRKHANLSRRQRIELQSKRAPSPSCTKCHSAGIHCLGFGDHEPSPVRGPRKRAVASVHNSGRAFATPSAAGQGRFEHDAGQIAPACGRRQNQAIRSSSLVHVAMISGLRVPEKLPPFPHSPFGRKMISLRSSFRTLTWRSGVELSVALGTAHLTAH